MTDLSTTFEIAAGTTMGTSHYQAHQNRQDGWWVERTTRCVAAIVCDGCGDPGSPCSEVGAAIGARLLARRLCELAGVGVPAETALEQARLDVLSHLGVLAAGMGDVEDAVRRYFLFTVVGALVTCREAVFFSIGDGLICVNDRVHKIGPYPDNAPPYMAYALIPHHRCSDSQHFTVHVRVPTPELDRFLLGTDGAAPLLDESLAVPGKPGAAGGLDRWLAEDLYYRNPAALPNRLRLLASDHQRIDWEAHRKLTDRGRVADDATLVLGRRVPGSGRGEEAADGSHA